MNIGIWGDSIVYGVGDTEALGWAGRLRKYYSKTQQYDVYSRGVISHTTQDVLKRFDVEVASTSPEIIIIAVGINDSKFINSDNEIKTPFEQFQKDVEILLQKAQGHARQVAVIGIPQINEEVANGRGSTSIFTNESSAKYDTYLKEVSGKMNVPYIDVWSLLDMKKDLSDGLHPNAVGYQKMFEHIYKFLLNKGIIE